MNIAILGSGNVGSALGDGLSAKEHNVFTARVPAKINDNSGRKFATIPDAVAHNDVVILALPWDAVPEVLQANKLDGKILIDVTNPLGPGLTLAVEQNTSGAETVADLAKGAKVVKAFNTTGFANMRNPHINGQALAMFYAGDDEAAKTTVRQLVSDIGFDAVYARALKHAR